jgi:hypothetical protein
MAQFCTQLSTFDKLLAVKLKKAAELKKTIKVSKERAAEAAKSLAAKFPCVGVACQLLYSNARN